MKNAILNVIIIYYNISFRMVGCDFHHCKDFYLFIYFLSSTPWLQITVPTLSGLVFRALECCFSSVCVCVCGSKRRGSLWGAGCCARPQTPP